MLERDVLPLVRLKLSKLGATVFRQNVGSGWRGSKIVKLGNNAIRIENARPVQMGLTTGSSDLIGWMPEVVTEDMVGRKVAIFMAVEVKRSKGGRTTEAQDKFIEHVKKAGGIVGVASSPEEAELILERWRAAK